MVTYVRTSLPTTASCKWKFDSSNSVNCDRLYSHGGFFFSSSVICSNAIAKSKRLGKAQLAAQFLLRMEEVSLRPGIVSYNNVINACAFSSKTKDDPETVLQIAMDVLAKAQKGPGANRITYQGALRVVCCFEKNTGETVWLVWFGICFCFGRILTSVTFYIKSQSVDFS